MIGLLVVTHGGLAEQLVAATRRIVQEPGPIEAISIEWDQDVEAIRGQMKDALAALDQGAGVILATDMFGGTPTNIALSFLEPGRVEVVTGINLPMMIKFTNLRNGTELAEAARTIASRGQSAISVASDILASRSGDSR
jgi:PTS system mannose-specific IIA component